MHRPPPHHPPFPLESEHPDALRAWGALFRTTHLQRQLMARKLAEHGTHPGQAACLREVGHHDGITQRDLATALHVTRPAVTVMLQKMERAGLIERVTDAEDQRLSRIHLTPSGLAKHAEMHELLGEIVESTVARLTLDDQRELARLLGALADNIEGALAESDAAPRYPAAGDSVSHTGAEKGGRS